MIFVVLGTQKFQCNRLLKTIDGLVEKGVLKEEVFAQRGHSDYQPRHYQYTDFLDKTEFENNIEKCSLLITHSGVGTILAGINHSKPVIVFPRLKKYREHVDDHQLDIARAFSKKKFVIMCGENDNLAEAIEQSRNYTFEKYVSQRQNMLTIISNYIAECEGKGK